MKYRVLRVGDKYYPQYKSWLLWRNFTHCGEPLCYLEKDHAINFCKTNEYSQEVIWESDKPEKHKLTGGCL